MLFVNSKYKDKIKYLRCFGDGFFLDDPIFTCAFQVCANKLSESSDNSQGSEQYAC